MLIETNRKSNLIPRIAGRMLLWATADSTELCREPLVLRGMAVGMLFNSKMTDIASAATTIHQGIHVQWTS